MKLLADEAIAAYREFITKMHGIAPNRVLMDEDTARRFKNELLIESLYQNPHPLTLEQVTFHGMRLVVDPHAIGIEVAYAR